jgi:hypothetical protein
MPLVDNHHSASPLLTLMPLFKSKKSKNKNAKLKAAEQNGSSIEQAPRQFKYAPQLSKTTFNIGGLPVNVFGLDELTPSPSRATAPPPPEICLAIHMHGRGGSADNEEDIVRHLYDRVHRSSQERGLKTREFLIVNFDARNHGHRMTSEKGQQGWKQGNERHAMDLYSMIVGMAQDVTFLVDFLPSYLFPYDDRRISQFVVTGKSLGGHATWHVLANDPRITIGVPFISCPSYAALITDRTRTSFVTNGPPHIPASLSSLISRIDPASQQYDSFDPSRNPFWGKRICMCSGEADKLVPWRCAEQFVRGLVTGEPQGQRGEMSNFRLVLLPGVGHTVTEASKYMK